VSKAFRRELHGDFLKELREKRLRPLIEVCQRHRLDLQLRGKYVSLYSDGLTVLELTYYSRKHEYGVRIAPAYLDPGMLPGQTDEGEWRVAPSALARIIHEAV